MSYDFAETHIVKFTAFDDFLIVDLLESRIIVLHYQALESITDNQGTYST